MNSAKRSLLRSSALASLLLIAPATPNSAQLLEEMGGGYLVYREVELEPDTLIADPTSLPQSPNRMDVKAIGMGKTQVANGRGFNAMMDNPALLAKERFSIDLLGVQASVPAATVDAAKFVEDNKRQFTTDGAFFVQIRDGYENYEKATTLQQRLEAIALIREGLVFPHELLEETIGQQDDPNTHGISAIPNLQLQWGNWGFSLYGSGQLGFQVSPSNSIDQLLSVQIPEDAQDLSAEVIKTLSGVVNSVFAADGSLAAEGLPQVFAISYLDAVGAIGYARQVKPGLDVGANLKVLNRRFSTKNIDAENLDDVLSEAGSELEESITGFTVDLGALYRYGKWGTQFGVAIQNLIPVKKLSSTARFSFVDSREYYLTDENDEPLVGFVLDRQGNPLIFNPEGGTFIPHAEGDTLLYIENKKVNLQTPFELKAPFLLNLGVWHPLRDNWDLSLDWVDVLAQDDKHEGYLSRFRVGTEYRLLKSLLALRGGMADKHLTLGAGLNLKFLQVDAAYAYDNFVGDNAYFLQLKLGW